MVDPVHNRRATLRDVAERSGVSYQTVSRVINNHPYVSPDKRARVLQVIEELGYTPNRAAQSLAGHKTQIIGVVSTGLNHYGPAQMVIHIERAAKTAGYDTIFTNMSDSTPESFIAAIDHVRRWHPDGLLIITPTASLTHEDVLRITAGLPIVQIDPQYGAATPSIVIDQRRGSQLAVGHLIELGHRRFCEIRGPQTWHDGIARHKSYLDTLHAAGLEAGAGEEGDWTSESGYQAAQRLLTRDRNFTALIVANDQMALGAIAALREHGRRVPEDVSVVGFDDIPEAAYFSPPLTTVRQDFALFGQLGVDYLMERITHPQAAPRQHVVQSTLVIRKSSAPPPE